MNTLPNAQWKPAVPRSVPPLAGLPPARPSCTRRSCIPQLVSVAAHSAPNSVALSAGPDSLTYAELDARSNRLASYLRSLGVGAEVPVGLCLDRSFDYIVSALAVWKAGGAYLPLDPSWPASRRAFALEDAQAPVLITRSTFTSMRARYLVDLDRDAFTIAREGAGGGFQCADVKRDHLAYIVYTSGSTGEPKGVEITHGNLLNMVFWHRRYYRVTAQDRASQLLGLGFDASMCELWPYLTAGASIAIADENVRTSPDALRDWIVSQGITIAAAPSVLAEPLLRSSWPKHTALRYLLSGGDTLHAHPPADLPFRVVNNYGPAECTVVASAGVVPPGSNTSAPPAIGRPVANTQVYLLDERLRPVLPGSTGEIYVGGSSVGRGYRNRPALTEECFLEDPFRSVAGARMYRTGDLGAMLADGQIGFRGRADNQVKIRGQRVELDEIASVLNRHPGVEASAVVAESDGAGDKRLVGYVVSRPGDALSGLSLREFLSAQVPAYMIPAVFARLNALPLTPNGKLDREALPAAGPHNTLDHSAFRAPQTAIEARVARIVAELFHIESVGLDDDFFALGGHSLLGTQLLLRLGDAFGVELSLAHIFEAETVAKLSAVIENQFISELGAMSEERASMLLAETVRQP